jgi:TonB family protein
VTQPPFEVADIVRQHGDRFLDTIVVCVLPAVAVGQVMAPRKTKNVRPVYPRESLQAGDEGVVLVELSVMPSGTVGQARILWSQCKRLEEAAVTAVRQWQYAPVHVNGEPVPFTIVADVHFRLPARFKERVSRIGACKWKEPPKPITE